MGDHNLKNRPQGQLNQRPIIETQKMERVRVNEPVQLEIKTTKGECEKIIADQRQKGIMYKGHIDQGGNEILLIFSSIQAYWI